MIRKLVLVVAAAAATTLLGDSLAPLNPEFAEWRKGRMSQPVPRGALDGNGSAAKRQLRASGVIPSPFDRSYLKKFYVDGEAVSSLVPQQARRRGTDPAIPSSYDTRVNGKGLTVVKNQNPYGTCWAHATCGCLETWLLNVGKGKFDLSENNLVNLHGRDATFDEGGNGDVASAYLLRWSGPVLESSDRYPNIGGSPLNLEPILHVQHVKWIPGRTSSTDNALIKKAVMKYGAVSVDYYHEESASGGVDLQTKNAYWNPPEGAYYRSAYHEPNHEVCIVGWDDSYSAGKFSTRPPTDGAFLIKNSWGTGFGTRGNEGFCWISYHDATLAQGTSYVFADTEAVDNYADIYQYDPLGLVGTYGTVGGMRYGAAMFTAREDMDAAAVGIYLPEPYAKYEISVYSGCTDGKPTSGTKLGSASGNASEYAGYLTVPVSCSSSIPKGTRFSAVVKVTTTSTRQLGLEYPVQGYSSGATAKPGETFASDNGTSWSDFTSELSGASFCCKVYAKRPVASSGTYVVKFAANGGTGSMADRTYSYGKSYTLPANAFAKEGYEFTGWKWSGGQFADCGEISFASAVSSPLTLTAQWQKVAATKPSAPVITEVTRGDLDSIAVSWRAVPGAKRYNLYWCAIEEFPSSQTPISVTGTAYLDTERMPGLEIYYWVSAVNDAGESAVSAPMSGYRAATCSVNPVSASYKASGAAGEVVTVEANTSWRVLDSSAWIHVVDGMGPAGVASFSYSVDANTSSQSRSGTITVGTSAVDHRVTRTISICQAGKSNPLPGVPEVNKALYTSKGFYLSWTEASNAKTYKIYRSTNPDYFGAGETCIVSGLKTTSYIDETANWLFAYDYRVVAVNDEGETSGPIVTLQGSLSGSAVVIPSITSGSFAAAGGSVSVSVSLIGSDTWEATSSADWITLKPTSGSANGALTVTAARNTTSSRRVATVLIGAGYKIGDVYLSSATVTFTQEAGDGSGGSGGGAAQVEVTLPGAGGTEYAYVTTPAGEKWEFLLSNRPSWVTGISLGGSDMTRNTSFSISANTAHTWTLGVTVAENTGNAREWTIPIMRGGALIGSFVISQRAAGEGGEAGGEDGGETAEKIPVAGGTKTFNVQYPANEKWTFDISRRPNWVTRLLVDGEEFSPSYISFSKESSREGVVVLSVTASANAGAERRWSIPITCGKTSCGSVDIIQAGGGGSSGGDEGGSSGGDEGGSSGGDEGGSSGGDEGGSSGGDEGGSSGGDEGGSSGGDVGGSSGGGQTPVGTLAFGPGQGSKFNISATEKAVVVGVSSLKWSNFSKRTYRGEQSENDHSTHSFYTFDDVRIVDAEKNSTKGDFDDYWCSALSEMNVFFWAGWINGYADEDAVKNYMRTCADAAGYDTGGWDFQELISPGFSESEHVGFVDNLSQFTKAFEGADRLFCLVVDFNEKFIWKGEGGVSHGVVCCGYSLDTGKSATEPAALKGLFIIDSDSDMYNGAGGASAPDAITYCPVKWNASKKVYEIDNVFGAKGTFAFEWMYSIRTPTAPTVNFTNTDVPSSGEALPGLQSGTDYGTVSTGVAFDPGLIDCTAGAGWSVKVSGLPAGLKYNAKTGKITGVPTKAGKFTVTFSATKKGETKQTVTITLTTAALPTWAQGTFSGYVRCADDDASGQDAYGMATMTVAANGKVNGKIALLGANWTFSAPSYVALDGGCFEVAADAKAGKATMPVEIRVIGGSIEAALPTGVAEGTMGGDCEVKMWRSVWKDKATAAAAKSELAKWQGLYTLAMEDGGYLSLTVGKDGNVKTAGKLADGTSLSTTAPLLLDDEVGRFVYVYTAPSAYKGGAFALTVGFDRLVGDDSPYLANTMGIAWWSSRNPQATGEYGAGFTRQPTFTGARYDKAKKLGFEAARLGFDSTPVLRYSRKVVYIDDETGKKKTETVADEADAVDTLSQDGLTATVNEKGAFVVAKATKPVQDKTTKEWSYDGINDGAMTLSLAQATGVIKGSYTFWYDYVSAIDETTEKVTAAHTSKKVAFEGIWVQGAEEMRGFYLWDATGSYDDPKTGKTKTYKYKESYPVFLVTE